MTDTNTSSSDISFGEHSLSSNDNLETTTAPYTPSPYQQPFTNNAPNIFSYSSDFGSSQTYQTTSSGFVQDMQQSAPPSTSKALGALMCGIFAIVLVWMPFVGIVLGIVACVLGVSATKIARNKSALAALITGGIGIGANLVFWLAVILVFAAAYSIYETEDSLFTDLLEDSTVLSEEEYDVATLVAQRFDELNALSEDELAEIGAELDTLFSSLIGFSFADLGIESTEVALWYTTDLSYEITYVNLYPSINSGTVGVWLETHNYSAALLEFSGIAVAFLASEEASSMSEADVSATLRQLFYETLASVSDDGQSSYLMIDVTLIDDSWVIDEDVWESEIDYAFQLSTTY